MSEDLEVADGVNFDFVELELETHARLLKYNIFYTPKIPSVSLPPNIAQDINQTQYCFIITNLNYHEHYYPCLTYSPLPRKLVIRRNLSKVGSIGVYWFATASSISSNLHN